MPSLLSESPLYPGLVTYCIENDFMLQTDLVQCSMNSLIIPALIPEKINNKHTLDIF